ncbi:hypothetical protein [Sphingomonas montana]|uniref:hypothetical protein n=1 Tax=Sphingomonas montana TaxID=1843236 RepID=UPI0013EBC73C|nr:hypothetical protein [Sphingomonas montana]
MEPAAASSQRDISLAHLRHDYCSTIFRAIAFRYLVLPALLREMSVKTMPFEGEVGA